MLDYIKERRIDIERYEREQYRVQREREIEERGNNRISYAEYLERERKLVEAGEENAKKRAENRVLR